MFDSERVNTMESMESNIKTKSQIVDLLVNHDVTPTQQRVKIAEVLLARHQHLSADQVLDDVNRERAVVSKATVYNTLGLFARKGLVREVIVDPSKVFYDSNTSDHHHIFNVDTGKLEDLHGGMLQIGSVPALSDQVETVGVDVVVRVRNKN